MIGPSLPTHFGGNFLSKKSHTSKCKTAETLRSAGLARLIRAIFQNGGYEIPPAYVSRHTTSVTLLSAKEKVPST